jgi:predicted DNA-binding transcriptional regulator AlpA
MPANRQLTLEQAKQLIETWQGAYEDYEYSQRLASRFSDAAPSAVVEMWQNGTNEKGRPLSKFELAALAERWGQIFGCLPPCDDADPSVTPPPSQPEPADDTVLSPRETAWLAGVSLSTIKRQVRDGLFPRPRRISRRRVGWPAREVKEWADRLDEQRHAPRNRR